MENSYFQELTLNLQQKGVIVCKEKDGFLPVELDGQRLCLAAENGEVRYWREDVTGGNRGAALEMVTTIVKVTAEYVSKMETAPHLTAGSLSGDYRLLADFNGTILAGHPTKYGVQFITWEQTNDLTSLYHGHYYGPGGGADSYISAKRDFAVRSGLIPRSALFAPDQMTEIYRSIHETLEGEYPITDDRQKILKEVSEQIERGVPDLETRVIQSNQKELEYAEQVQYSEMGLY